MNQFYYIQIDLFGSPCLSMRSCWAANERTPDGDHSYLWNDYIGVHLWWLIDLPRLIKQCQLAQYVRMLNLIKASAAEGKKSKYTNFTTERRQNAVPFAHLLVCIIRYFGTWMVVANRHRLPLLPPVYLCSKWPSRGADLRPQKRRAEVTQTRISINRLV